MRVTLIVLVVSLLLSCGARDVQNHKIQENSKIEVNEVTRDDIQEVVLSSNEITTSIVEVDTSNLIGLDIEYKGEYGDEIEIIKDVGRLIIKGSGDIDIKALKADINKNKASDVNLVESSAKNSATVFNSKKNTIQDTKIKNQDKKTQIYNYSVFYFFVLLLLIVFVFYLWKRFKDF